MISDDVLEELVGRPDAATLKAISEISREVLALRKVATEYRDHLLAFGLDSEVERLDKMLGEP